MSDLSHLMKTAADEPTEPFDPESAWHRGRRLRTRRAIVASAVLLIVVVGAGFTVANTLPQEGAITPADQAEEPAPIEEIECEDQTLPGKDVFAYCIARGTYDGDSWFYGAYIDDDGHLCTHFEEPRGGGGGGCGKAKVGEKIPLGLSSGGPGSPVLTAEVPERSARVVVETEQGMTVEAPLYDAPEELGVHLRFVLLFDLPKGAQEVVAYDSSGTEVARASLRPLFEFPREFDEPRGDVGGWMIAHGMIGDEPWGLSADHRAEEDLLCVMLGLGNDQEAADVEIAATSCYEGSETDLALEQMWWEGLQRHAPVYGAVSRDVHRVELRLDGENPQEIEIRPSPAEGLWRDQPVYGADFIVAFPPLGATGEIAALDGSGRMVASWSLCMSNRPQGTHGSCNQATEFWKPSRRE